MGTRNFGGLGVNSINTNLPPPYEMQNVLYQNMPSMISHLGPKITANPCLAVPTNEVRETEKQDQITD